MHHVLLIALEARSPGALLTDLANRIRAETDLDRLQRWLLQAATAASVEAFQAEMG